MFYNIIVQLFISINEIKFVHATRLTVSFVSLLMHECTCCVLNENYVLKITSSCRKLILIRKLNNFVIIFVSRGDHKFSQAHRAFKIFKVTFATQGKSRLISVRSNRLSDRERIQKDAQRSNTC